MPARKPGRLPPLNALRAFEVSARHLNFRAAADEIGVTQARSRNRSAIWRTRSAWRCSNACRAASR